MLKCVEAMLVAPGASSVLGTEAAKALQEAITSGNLYVVCMILNSRLARECIELAASKTGIWNTMLTFAVMNGTTDVLRAIILSPVGRKMVDLEGNTVLEEALKYANTQNFQLIREALSDSTTHMGAARSSG